MPSESHATVPASTRHGTRPLGEKARNFAQLEPGSNGTTCSSKGIASSRNNTQGLSDHEE
jgi:hypothetical protein